MRIVLDTNVIVAAKRSSRGASSELFRLLGAGAFSVAISAPLVFEYEEILVRELVPEFLTLHEVDEIIRFICSLGEKFDPGRRISPILPDRDDDFVLELAVTANVEYIVTHNTAHFAKASKFTVKVIAPGAFLKVL